VRKGQLVADVEENKLGSPIHASIDGVVNQVTQNALTIRGQEE
jgi:biotin carboxyl carrier protein